MGTCTGRSFGVPERKAKTGSITKYAARIHYQLQNFSIFIFRKSVGLQIIYNNEYFLNYGRLCLLSLLATYCII